MALVTIYPQSVEACRERPDVSSDICAACRSIALLSVGNHVVGVSGATSFPYGFKFLFSAQCMAIEWSGKH